MTRVLYCHTSTPGGAELAAPGLAHELNAEFWVRGAGSIVAAADRLGVETVQLPAARDRRPRGFRAVFATLREIIRIQKEMFFLLRSRRPSLVLSNSIQGILHLAVPALISRTPLVVYVRDLGQGGNRPHLEVLVFRVLLTVFSRGQVFNSMLTQKTWNVRRKRQIVVPTAVEEKFFSTPHTGGTGTDAVIVGRVSKWKGQAYVVDAMNILAERRPVKLTIVGSSLFGETDTLPNPDFPLEQVGQVSDPEAYMAKADVVVHASTTPEPFGQVLAQAAAVGAPIVCSDRGGQTEWLVDGVNCLTADPEDLGKLATAIAAVFDDPEAALERAARARDAAEAFRPTRAYSSLKTWLTSIERSTTRPPNPDRAPSATTRDGSPE